ncbi:MULTISPECIES: DUF6779 domain-containing protein [unclassified Mycobacterium]|uniref:DUF6779 domain-containing protein n=1 Tax=unclassified Mycobacterium TaxID=2642494 RepID=UPI002740B52A|nr:MULTISPECIES: DUF6779 domain-containing protein [unclassified Mycobacterium]MDP7706518.1 hypothetical protein [Mycobacterium sp. TY815]MDP7725696.1 hypothetical protein [Mycobacterium sp. TY814]
MTVLSRGARVRRGGRRPGWVLLTTLLVLAIGASSALVFTDRVELLKLAVILALWAAVAGAFVSVLYRRQAEADQARARDMKLVYDLQLDREISARREYELTVESQLRRELAAEIRAQAADEIAALRAELSALRTNLEILFDTDLEHRPALETLNREAARALTDRSANAAKNGESPPADWVASDRVTAVRQDEPDEEPALEEDVAIIDVPEEPLLPPRQPVNAREYAPPPQQPAGPYQPRHRPPPPPQQLHFQPQPQPQFQPPPPPPPPPPQPPPQPQTQPQPQPQPAAWQPVSAEGQWLPPGTPGSHWAPAEAPPAPARAESEGRRRRYRDDANEADVSAAGAPQDEAPPQYGGRRSRSRHSAEYRDFGVGNLGRPRDSQPEPAPEPPPAPPPPRLAPAPPAPRHRSAEEPVESEADPDSGGHSAADLLARFQVQPSGGGRRRRRDA